MAYFKLTQKFWYLMQGGTNRYIDKIALNPSPTNPNSFNLKFPKIWLESTNPFRPSTMVITIDDGKEPLPFRQLNKLKIFSIPVNENIYEALKSTTKLSDLLNKIYVLLIEYNQYLSQESRGIPPAVTLPVDYYEKSLKFPKIVFAEEFTSDTFNKGSTDPSFGEIFLWITWMAGLTPRPHILIPFDDEYQRYLINFIVRPQPNLTTQPTTMETLEKALTPFNYPFKSDQALGEVLKYLATEKPKIQVSVPPLLTNQAVNLQFSSKVEVTFTQVMDAIASRFNAVWDWQGSDCAYLMPLEYPVMVDHHY